MLIIFDCDGTLVDSQHIIIESMCAAFIQNNLPKPPDDAVKRIIGLSLPDAVRSLVDGKEEQLVSNIVNSYRKNFSEIRNNKRLPENLFPNVMETLDSIRNVGHSLGIATGKSKKGLIATLDFHDILDHFITLQTVDDAPGKPNPEMLYRAMNETGFKICHTIFIGDTVYDIEMAKNAGIEGYGVSWGYHHEEELIAAGATLVLQDIKDILPLLE